MQVRFFFWFICLNPPCSGYPRMASQPLRNLGPWILF
uniref:Uncharacterized protein n=1 Tax=Anguilla anguilla TaxID=7936 RepID=A0A0E9WJU2_ANGAN